MKFAYLNDLEAILRLESDLSDCRGSKPWRLERLRCRRRQVKLSRVVSSWGCRQAVQSLKVVRICINTSNPNAQQTAAVASVMLQALPATYSQLPPLKWQRSGAARLPKLPEWRSHPVRHNPCPNPKSNLKHKHKHKPNTEATHQHQHLTRDAANQLMLLGRWLSGCCQAKSGSGSRDGAVRSFPIPFVALSYDYIKQTLRQRITCIRQGPVTVP